MKIGCLQLNATIGAFEANVARIKEAYGKAVGMGAELVVAPELFPSGYPPRDLLFYSDFIAANDKAVDEIRAFVGDVPLVCGLFRKNPRNPGKPLCNSAGVFHKGRLVAVRDKMLLPTYDVFDEDRYFEPAPENLPVEIAGIRLGVTVCEDIWNDEDFWAQRLYQRDPVKQLLDEGVDLIVNVSASPWHMGKGKLRRDMLAKVAGEGGIPVVQVNVVGGNDELLFDGQSMVFNKAGELTARGRAFDEHVFVADTEGPALVKDGWPGDEEQLFAALAMGTRDYVRKCGFSQVVLGLSGGIDSALTAAIAVESLGPDNVFGVLMPSRYSSQGSIDDSVALARNLEIAHDIVSIDESFSSVLGQLAPVFAGREPDVTEENLQARLRGITLMAISNKFNRLVLTTGNKSELAAGYCTLYGDMCGALAVINDVPKVWVYRLAEWLNRGREIIPWNTIHKAPSAELRPNQKDQDSLPPYEALDRILEGYVVEHQTVSEMAASGADESLVRDLVRKVDINEYKRRQAAPGLRVTSKAFGVGRRMPIAQKFRHL